MKNINRGERYIIINSLRGYILYDRLDRVQIGDDFATIKQGIERRRIIYRRMPERV
jgi:hypothetical protein